MGSPTEMVTAVVTITGIGGYVGTNTKEFRISPFNIADCELKGRLEAYDDGYGVYYPLCNSVEVWNGNAKLTLDKDYTIDVEYAESYEVGQTYQATIKGTGDWGGTKTFEFTVIELAHTVVFDPNGGTGEIASDTATKGQHYYLPECTFTAPAGFAFDHWEVSCEPNAEKQPGDYFTSPYIWSESDVQTITVKAVWKDVVGERLEGYSLSIQEDGDIGVNFYMSLDNDIASDPNAKMRFVIPINSKTGETKTLDMDIPTLIELGGKNYYVFKCPVAAKEMTATITAQMYVDGVATGREYTYTVRDYAEYLISNAYEADGTTVKNQEYVNALPLVQAMLHYGASAQTLFNNNASDLADENIAKTVYADPTQTLKTLINNSGLTNLNTTSVGDNLTFDGASLNLGSKTAYTLYYAKDENYSGEVPTVNCNYEVKVVETASEIRYIIQNISAGDLLKNITVTIGTKELTVNPATYFYAALTAQNTDEYNYDNLKAAVTALYYFNEAAKSYKGVQ